MVTFKHSTFVCLLALCLVATGCKKEKPRAASGDLTEETIQVAAQEAPAVATQAPDKVASTEEVQGEDYLKRLEGIMQDPDGDKAKMEKAQKSLEEREKASYGLDYTETKVSAAQVQKDKVVTEFNKENADLRSEKFIIQKDMDKAKKNGNAVWKAEVQAQLYAAAVKLDSQHDALYDALIKKQLAEITALAVERKDVVTAKIELQKDTALLETYTKYPDEWLKHVIEWLDMPIKDGRLNGNKTSATNVKDAQERFLRALADYYKDIAVFNAWVQTNWERFNVENGLRVIKDTKVQDEYKTLTKKLLDGRKGVERARKNYLDKSGTFKDIMSE